MNPITIIIGLIFCCYGVLVLIFGLQGREEKFKKLESMRKVWGEKAGSLIHYIAYGLIPILFGIWIIYAGFRGIFVFDIFK